MNTKALLIIDMQNESFPDNADAPATKAVVARINALSRNFRNAGSPVIIVQHDGTLQNEYIPGSPGWELLPALEVSKEDIRIQKTANDSFYETPLHDVLARLHVNEVVITGSATDFCVDSTVQSALVKNYNVTVVKDGHTAGDRPHLDGKTIVAHYNWVWQYLTPTQGRIQVKPAAELQAG